MESFNKILKNRHKLVFIDFEGTQFSHEIIAIGAAKVYCDKNGKISDNYETYKRYVKCVGPIGKIVSSMTTISNDTLKENGITFEEMLNEFQTFIDGKFDDCAFLAFGNNDIRMIIESIKISRPSNESIGISICKNAIDFLAFISQYIKDENGNNYSLVNYLKLYSIEPYGQSHDPLNDAIDLMNLYKAFMGDINIKKQEYIKVLKKIKSLPQPVKRIVNRLINNETITPNDFDIEITKYLE